MLKYNAENESESRLQMRKETKFTSAIQWMRRENQGKYAQEALIWTGRCRGEKAETDGVVVEARSKA